MIIIKDNEKYLEISSDDFEEITDELISKFNKPTHISFGLGNWTNKDNLKKLRNITN
ncbi:hypothetical protein Phi19:1_gp076 [Cellulophaga phage phi19:1]|uniref:Uncharacterized protein n=1 Tax=Cellulophaga phage phi19:1 TaxID=1327970 RepID=R9ZW90_9CAUD|nr:hypothetical protein Phi19:1_gp076 [Cellulophaga phage phi19:1]AGO47366.1 hypothetical protein Phi19:1_gp076 [Cellulophaga phage phi19:1]